MKKATKIQAAKTSASDFSWLATIEDRAARIALFLTGEKGSCLALWHGRLSAAQQKALFGEVKYSPLAHIFINGAEEIFWTSKKVCFGTDFENSALIKF